MEGKSEWKDTVVLTNHTENIFPHKLQKMYEHMNTLLGIILGKVPMQVRGLETLVLLVFPQIYLCNFHNILVKSEDASMSSSWWE